MKFSGVKIAAIALIAALAVPKPASAFITERDWQYVQAIGGIKFDTPKKEDDGRWILPVEIDVTGAKTITVAPTETHPGMVCAGLQAEIHDQDVYLALFTGYPWIKGAGGGCPPIVLGYLQPGKYTLYYNGLNADPLKLTDITITP